MGFNLERLQKIKSGKHVSQNKTSISYQGVEDAAEKSKVREVGEKWEQKDADGKVTAIWEQRQGYRVKRSPNYAAIDKAREFLNSYPNCKPTCKLKKKTWIDRKFRAYRGMCHQCSIEQEDLMKLNGTWDDFQKTSLTDNAISFFKESDEYIAELEKDISTKTTYSGKAGVTEDWAGNEILAKKIIKEYKEYKEYVFEELENL